MAIRTFGPNAVDWEQRIDLGRLRDDRLARLNLSGGNIHSIALNAAFLAARDGQVVTMPILTVAARAELKKLEKGFSETELRAIGALNNPV